jgi:hypothetical protein
MVKRDTIQRYAAIVTQDEMGGNIVQLNPAEIVDANVSINATLGEITQYGLKNEMVLHVVTNIELDEFLYSRYKYSGRLFRLVRQIKQGNEYFSTLVEVNEGGVA